ncbi:hypothetical protein [Streptococcus orisratti]|uniref:competence regulator inhibitor paratox n=1 Tax=Streptococcus orisratti TaxID=114652 RepID=UPI0029425BEE|nr:hypothetical protein [Streptococcus orisratti]
MIDLNDLKAAVENGLIDKYNVTIVRRDGEIVDYVENGETIAENEQVETMDLIDVLRKVFNH